MRLLVLTAVDLEARTLARHLGLSSVPGAGWPRFAGGVLEIVPIGVAASQLARDVGADEPGTAGDERIHWSEGARSGRGVGGLS